MTARSLVGAPNEASWASPWGWAPFAILLVAAVLARTLALLQGANFWTDEAMLYGAIEQAQAITPSTPLPLFEQAAPFMVVALYKALINAVGFNEVVLRLPSFFANITALGVVALIARRTFPPLGAAAAVLLAAFCTEGIIQATEFKQYSFEFLAAALVLLTALRVYGHLNDAKRVWLFSIVSMAVLPFSFTAPIATAACGFALAVVDISERGWRDFLRARSFLLAGAVWLVVGVAWQVLFVDPLTAYQFEGTANVYARGILSLSHPETFANVAKVLVSALTVWATPTALRRALNFAILLIWAAGILLHGRRDLRGHAPFLGLMLIMIGASFAGKLPIQHERQFIFALPIYGLSLGTSLQSLMESLCRGLALAGGRVRSLAVVVPTLVALVLSSFAVSRAATFVRSDQLGTFLSRAPANACPLVWTYYMAWPTIRLYGPRLAGARYVGIGSIETGVPGWYWRVRNDLGAYRRQASAEITAHDRMCLLFSYDIDVQGRLVGPAATILKDAQAAASCTLIERSRGAQLYSCARRAP